MSTIEKYVACMAADGYRAATILWRANALRRVEAMVGPLEHATEADLATWWASTLHLKPGSRRTELVHVRCWQAWAVEEGLIEQRRDRRLRAPKLPRSLPKPIPEEYLARAIAEATPRIRAWVILGAYAGLRAGECALWRPEHVSGGVLTVPNGKGGHERQVPAHELVLGLDRCWGASVQSHNVTHSTRQWFARRGIPAHHHQCRHRFGTNLYRQTRDLRLVQELLGHANPATTAIYTALDHEAKADAIAALA